MIHFNLGWKTARRRPAARRTGSMTVVVALSLTVLLGFCALSVDYGFLVVDANRLQRGCDAAALAGATQLKMTGNDGTDTTNARNVAINVAAKNGVTVPTGNVTFTTASDRIRVQADTTRAFFFGGIIGVRNGQVTRAASAGVAAGDDLSTAVNGKPRVAPIGITWETYNAYKSDAVLHPIELIRQNKQIFGLDDLVLFDLRDNNAKSGAKMQDQLTGAATEVSSIGDYETTLNASQSSEQKKFKDGLQTLFSQSAAAPWNDSTGTGTRYNDILAGTLPRNNPRVINLIVTPQTTSPHNGTYDTQVQGFAPVYVESYETLTIGGETVVHMNVRFLPPTNSSDGGITPAPAGTALSGVRMVQLVGEPAPHSLRRQWPIAQSERLAIVLRHW